MADYTTTKNMSKPNNTISPCMREFDGLGCDDFTTEHRKLFHKMTKPQCVADSCGWRCDERSDPLHRSRTCHFAIYEAGSVSRYQGLVVCKYSLTNTENLCLLRNDKEHITYFNHTS